MRLRCSSVGNAPPLVDAGLHGFHCSTRRYWEPEFEGSDLNLAGWTKKLTGKTSITVGSVGLNADFIGAIVMKESSDTRAIDDLVARLEKGEFDLVAVGLQKRLERVAGRLDHPVTPAHASAGDFDSGEVFQHVFKAFRPPLSAAVRRVAADVDDRAFAADFLQQIPAALLAHPHDVVQA